MQIAHKLTFSHRDEVDSVLKAFTINTKQSILPGGGYLIHIDVAEDDIEWPRLRMLAREKNAVDVYTTIFTAAEIEAAEWVRLSPAYEQGYPQPEDGWEEATYAHACPECGAGYQQIAPFRLRREPRLGRHDFMSLYWAYTLFATPAVFAVLAEAGITGYEQWPALLRSSAEPSQLVMQVLCIAAAHPALVDADDLEPVVCPQCGVARYRTHKRGMMRLRSEALRRDVDMQFTHEWFGSGGYSFRELLVSQRLARLVLQHGWRGVRLQPVLLV